MTRGRADAVLLGASLIWGLTFVVTKDALTALAPLTLLAWRFAIGGAALALLGWRSLPTLRGRVLGESTVLGLCLFAGFFCQTVGLQTTTPARSAFITSLMIPFTPLFGFLLFRRRPARRVLAGIGLACLGMTLLAGRGGWGEGLRTGDLWSLACAVAFALQILLVARYSRVTPATSLAVGQVVVAAVCFLLTAPLAAGGGRLDGRAGAAVLFLGVGGTALAIWMQVLGQRHTTANRAALIYTAEPVFAALFSYVLWGERLGGRGWAAGGLIVAGILLAEWQPPERRWDRKAGMMGPLDGA